LSAAIQKIGEIKISALGIRKKIVGWCVISLRRRGSRRKKVAFLITRSS
jgi:hypothetical protein